MNQIIKALMAAALMAMAQVGTAYATVILDEMTVSGGDFGDTFDTSTGYDASLLGPGSYSFLGSLANGAGDNADYFHIFNLTPGDQVVLFLDFNSVDKSRPELLDSSGAFLDRSIPSFISDAGTVWVGFRADEKKSGKYGITLIITSVPEPATLALLGIGLMGLGFAKRKPE